MRARRATVLAGGVLALAALTPAQAVDWPAVLARPAPPLPAPRDELVWISSLEEGLRVAREEGRPLFVTLRCLPCKQCADFDRDVLEGGPELSPLLRRFVTVRITSAADVDLRLLPLSGFQDLDLSWWGWLLSPEGSLYGVFGGRDHVSDTTRISVTALRNTLQRVLDHHYDPRRSERGVDRPAPALDGPRRTPESLPGYRPWSDRQRGARECLHCHQVAEILRQPRLSAGTFDKRRDLADWPLPEQVGLVLERDHGLRVLAVRSASPAAAAGVRAGDVVRAANGESCFSQADLRGVLHRAPRAAGSLGLWLEREGVFEHTSLTLPSDWWASDEPVPAELAWRMSVSQGNVGAAPGFFPLAASPADRARTGIPEGRMAVRPFFGRDTSSPAYLAGLRPGMTIVAVNGESPDLAGRPFLVWFRLRFEPGDVVELRVAEREAAIPVRVGVGE